MVERNPLRVGLLSGLSTPVIDGDGKAAGYDLCLFVLAFRAFSSNPGFDADYDANKDDLDCV